MSGDPDVVVIGAGPNGLVAAALLAERGLGVVVLEANAVAGGAARTVEATLPGFRHDLCSGFYPLFPRGPIGRLPLGRYGLEWCGAERPYGGGTPRGRGVAQVRTAEGSAVEFERAAAGDAAGYREMWGWWEWGDAATLSLLYNPIGHPGPLVKGAPLLRSPRRLIEFSQHMVAPARNTAERFFRGEDAQVWFIGSTLHSDLGPDDAGGGAFAMTLSGLSQQVGMPVPRGGAQAISDALAGYVADLGGRVLTGQRVERVVVRGGRAVAVRTADGEYPARRGVLATVQPQELFLELVGAGELPSDFVKLVRRFRWGTGMFKLDCALSGAPEFGPEALRGTLVLHLARGVGEMERGVAAARRGALPEHPMLIVGLHSLVDPSRAPDGKHTLWLETHVPWRIEEDAGGRIGARDWAGAKGAFVERIFDELEEYAPGLRDLVLGVHAASPEDLFAENRSLVGGDIVGGTFMLDQQLVFRPLPGWFRYQTPIKGLYMSGAFTHPGAGVHGGPGANAARVMLGDLRLELAGEWLGGLVGGVRGRF